MKLKLDRSPTESRSDEVPQTAIEHVADVASQRVEELEKENASLKRRIVGLAEKNKALDEQFREYQGKVSYHILSTGGNALLDAPDILTEVRGIAAMLDRQAQFLTALGLKVDLLEKEHYALSGRVPV